MEMVLTNYKTPPQVAGGTATPHKLYYCLSAREGACISRKAHSEETSFSLHGPPRRFLCSSGRLRIETLSLVSAAPLALFTTRMWRRCLSAGER